MKGLRCIVAIILLLCLLSAGCAQNSPMPDRISETKSESLAQAQLRPETQEIRAVWISCFDLPPQKEIATEDAFRTMANEMIANICDAGFNTVFLHVRPYSDALYRSELFPYSAYVAGKEGDDPGFDALRIFCACAQSNGVSLHAWLNPFRVGSASGFDERADTNPAKRILADKEPANDSRIANVNGTLYYNPANRENRELVVSGARELLENYPIDGIHIDDYFYPTTESYIDQTEYAAYLASGGTASLGDWRRAQINTLVRALYTCTKSFGEDKIFSISPALNIEKNRETLFADVARWAANDGYCDWLIPQVYVGFLHETQPFRETVKAWQSLKRSENVRLLYGLAAYKCGKEDAFAGTGRKEWIECNDILSRQIVYLRDCGDCDGFCLFAYSDIFGGKMSDNSKSEMISVVSVL